MALDETDWRIIEALHLDPDRSIRKVAAMVGISETGVRNRLLALEQSGSVSYSTIIDLRPLGFYEYSLWFSGTNVIPPMTIEALIHSSRVIAVNYFGESFEIILCARDPEDLQASIDQMYLNVGGLPSEKLLSIWSRWTFLPLCRSVSRPPPSRVIESGTRAMFNHIDDLDHEILSQLSSLKTRWSVAKLARKLGRPERTVQYRLNRLRKMKVLVGNILTTIQDPGSSSLYRLALSINAARDGARRHIRQVLEKNGRIQSIVDCLGHWDFEALVQGMPANSIDLFLRQLKDECSAVLSAAEVFRLVSRPKFSPYPFKGVKDLAV